MHSSKTKYYGACLDPGSQTSLIGYKLSKAYCESIGVKFKTKHTNGSFRFGDVTYKSLENWQSKY